LRAGLVDEVDIDSFPIVIGGRGTPALFDAFPLGPDEWPHRLDLLSPWSNWPGGGCATPSSAVAPRPGVVKTIRRRSWN